MTKLFEVIYEDDELLVVNKPADLVCHPTKGDVYSSLISRMRLHCGEGSQPQLINRLDRETSGLVLAAKTAEAARELRRLFESRTVRKEYLAIVHGEMATKEGVIEAALGKDVNSTVAIKDCVRADGAPACTEYRAEQVFKQRMVGKLDQEGWFTLVRVMPRTGRKHQIRIHLAYLEHPIVGDKIYGGDETLYLALVERRLTAEQRERLILPHHALHAERLAFSWRGKKWDFHAQPEVWFEDFAAPQRRDEHRD